MLESNWRGRLIRYAPVFLWVAVIFFLSSPEGSFAQTSRIIGPLLHFFFPNMTEETQDIIHGFIRKTAHFTEYSVLAFLTVRALSRSTYALLRKWRFILPLLLVAVIASLDEFNQSFEPSRTSSFRDVLLDISGGTIMIALLWLVKWPRPLKQTDTPE